MGKQRRRYFFCLQGDGLGRQYGVAALFLVFCFSGVLSAQTDNGKSPDALFPDGPLLAKEAHAPELRLRRYTMKDGLSHPGTYWLESIIQDREGFLWFTTFNGLNRFDGKNFKLFQYSLNYPKSLGNNFTTAICEAEDGRIWVGTNSGVYIFDPETETFDLLRHDPANPKSLCGNDINFINKDRDGNMWVGTAVDGVCRWSKVSGDFEDFGGYFRDGLVFFQQRNGLIWVGNTDGLHQEIAGKDAFLAVELPAAFKQKKYAMLPTSSNCRMAA